MSHHLKIRQQSAWFNSLFVGTTLIISNISSSDFKLYIKCKEMENRKSKQSKVITNYSTQWQMEWSKGKNPQPDKTSYAFRSHIYTKGTATFCPLEASPFSSCKHLI